MPITRSETNAKAFRFFIDAVLPIVVDGGWIDVRELSSIYGTNRVARNSIGNDGHWRTLALRKWPEVGRLVVVPPEAPVPAAAADGAIDGQQPSETETEEANSDINGGDGNNVDDDGESKDSIAHPRLTYSSYRELFIDYPRVWLTMEAARVRLTRPEWTVAKHLGHGRVLECGKCGCNCSNGSLCPGIPMESEYRYERKTKLGYYESRVDVPDGEGYEMSDFTFVAVNRFCEPCFERLVELEIVKREDYDKVAGTNILEETTRYIVQKEGTNPWGAGRYFRKDSFFSASSEWSWQKNLDLETDDAAVVISHALIHPNCAHKHLEISDLHFNDDYSKYAYKAFAYALAINTSLESITMQFDECCDGPCIHPDEDRSSGLFLKALRHNRSSSLYRMQLCDAAFGCDTYERLKAALKPKPSTPEWETKKRKVAP